MLIALLVCALVSFGTQAVQAQWIEVHVQQREDYRRQDDADHVNHADYSHDWHEIPDDAVSVKFFWLEGSPEEDYWMVGGVHVTSPVQCTLVQDGIWWDGDLDLICIAPPLK